MDLHGKRILVTGADGFIGSHLVERLVADGHRVRAFVQYNSLGTRGWLDRAAPETLAASPTSGKSPARSSTSTPASMWCRPRPWT